MGRRSIDGRRARQWNERPDMWLGRCACGRDITVPTVLVEAIVRVRAFFRAQRLGPTTVPAPRPLGVWTHWTHGRHLHRPGHWGQPGLGGAAAAVPRGF